MIFEKSEKTEVLFPGISGKTSPDPQEANILQTINYAIEITLNSAMKS